MKKSLTIFLFAAAFIIFSGCESPFTAKVDSLNLPKGYGAVRISVNSGTDKAGERTVFPANMPNAEDITSDCFFFYNYVEGETELGEPVKHEKNGDKFFLPAGSYIVRVKAKAPNAEKPFAEGTSGEFTITAGQVNPDPALEFVSSEGLGKFKFSVILPPPGENIYEFELSNNKWGSIDGNGGISIVCNSTNFFEGTTYGFYSDDNLSSKSEDKWKFSSTAIEVQSGYYFFDLTVTDADKNVITGKREVVHIYDGLTTEIKAEDGWIFTYEDFSTSFDDEDWETVSTWEELSGLFPASNVSTEPLKIIITGSDIEFEQTIQINSEVTIVANNDVKLSRGTDVNVAGSEFTGSFFEIASGSLTLGLPYMKGSIEIDGEMEEGVQASSAIIFVNGGFFTMNSGLISGNTNVANQNVGGGNGGGVYVENGTFTMNGGEISGNTIAGFGGGVYVESGTFAMNGGEISGNTAVYDATGGNGNGGGVYVGGSGTFTMSGGKISLNHARMGGGVFVEDSAKEFSTNGGTIYGNDNTSNTNTATIGVPNGGLAIFVDVSPSTLAKAVNKTVFPDNTLSYCYNDNEDANSRFNGDWDLLAP